MRTILYDAYREAKERKGMDEDTLDCVREQVGYILDALQDDLDAVANTVREAGVLPELE